MRDTEPVAEEQRPQIVVTFVEHEADATDAEVDALFAMKYEVRGLVRP